MTTPEFSQGSGLERVHSNGDALPVVGEGASSPEQEHYRIASLRELNLGSEQDLSDYFRLLTHPDNIEHFSNPPTDTENLKQKLVHDSTHAYLAENMLGEVVGGGGINDAPEGEHDHWLVKIVVDPKSQSRGLGKQLVAQLVEKAFSAKTPDGRDRTKIDAAVIRNVRGWERMPRILEQLGFRPLHILLQQVDVQEQGAIVKKPTERWELTKDDWVRKRRTATIKNVIHPPL